jgi:hypothetical protein
MSLSVPASWNNKRTGQFGRTQLFKAVLTDKGILENMENGKVYPGKVICAKGIPLCDFVDKLGLGIHEHQELKGILFVIPFGRNSLSERFQHPIRLHVSQFTDMKFNLGSSSTQGPNLIQIAGATIHD